MHADSELRLRRFELGEDLDDRVLSIDQANPTIGAIFLSPRYYGLSPSYAGDIRDNIELFPGRPSSSSSCSARFFRRTILWTDLPRIIIVSFFPIRRHHLLWCPESSHDLTPTLGLPFAFAMRDISSPFGESGPQSDSCPPRELFSNRQLGKIRRGKSRRRQRLESNPGSAAGITAYAPCSMRKFASPAWWAEQ